MTNQDEINELNSIIKARIGVSKIHGVGVIATRDISKGEMVYADRMPKVYQVPYGSMSKLFPEVREIILERWPSIINRGRFIAPDARLLSFMNHSEGDESNYDPATDTAIRDIKKGEEITENYKTMENWSKIYSWLK